MPPRADGPFRGGKVHVLRDRCSSCVFRGGNLMHLRPGALKSIVEDNLGVDSALTCHQTLPGVSDTHEPAVCKGFFDAYQTETLPLRLAVAMDMLEYDDPPVKETHVNQQASP